jgi:hypothetical protein
MKVTVDGVEMDIPRKISAETLITEYAKRSLTGVRAVLHYFVDGERQRFWPIGWNEVIDSIEDGDRFEIEMGELIPPPN